MRHLVSSFIIFMLITSSTNVNAAVPLDQSNFFSEIISTGEYELSENINAENHTTPIIFSGSLDGKNFKIYNLEVPLFDVLLPLGPGEPTEIINLRLEGDEIIGNGVLANEADNVTITNVHVSANLLSGSTPNVGGLVGLVEDVTIDSSSSTVDVSSIHDYVGGLVGQAARSTINKSYATGDVTSTGAGVGGLVGFTEEGQVTNSYASGDVETVGDKGGGLIGGTFNTTIENSHASGNVQAGYYVGGLVGYAPGGEIVGAYATGEVTSNQNNVGGLVGESSQINISNSYATGNVSSSGAVGVGGNDLGGLVGLAFETIIENSYATGNVTGDGDPIGRLVGGLLGDSSIDALSYGTGILDRLEEVEGGREIHLYVGPPAPSIVSVLNTSVPAGYSQAACINDSLPYLTLLSSTYSNSCTSGVSTSSRLETYLSYEILAYPLESIPLDYRLYNFIPSELIFYPTSGEIKEVHFVKVDVNTNNKIKLPTSAMIQLQLENLKNDDIQVWLKSGSKEPKIFADLQTVGSNSIILPTVQLRDEGNFSFEFTSRSAGSGAMVVLGGLRVLTH